MERTEENNATKDRFAHVGKKILGNGQRKATS